jgi:hypothetical protein
VSPEYIQGLILGLAMTIIAVICTYYFCHKDDCPIEGCPNRRWFGEDIALCEKHARELSGAMQRLWKAKP